MRLQFATKEEALAATMLTAKWLPRLLIGVEEGIKALGLEILKKSTIRYADGRFEPAIRVKSVGGGQSAELYLGNTLAEFLTLDRDDRPHRLDTRLFVDTYAECKLDGLVKSRLNLLKAIATAKSPKALKRELPDLARGFAHIRVWEPIHPANDLGMNRRKMP
jgi:hypothetical protein